ncbi:alpha/beta hydrolase family protein [Sphingomonas sp. CLY1604]|uniref:alpha/beta hydrolase family protein n=1 Tax=Sphingomonas sp. CLY1604 TaxID=3457786 RepID=UPI003FD8C487
MAMFSYFPGNYVWNLAVDIAIESGAQIGEIEEMCAPLREAALQGADVGTVQFMARWVEMADRLSDLAEEDLALGRAFSASGKLDRAALYYQTAERMLPHGHADRMAVFRKGIDAFRRAAELGGLNRERVEISYGGGVIPGWFTRAERGDGARPTMVFVNGLDSSKEMLVWTKLGTELARRGVSTLHMDQPGTGEALRTHGLTAVPDTERWASVVVDHLEGRADVDPARIGMMGLSLGGYYAPRAVAFEPRFALGAVWGANHNWGEVQLKRLNREGENPVPHYWEHVRWVWGAADMDEFLQIAPRVSLEGVLDRVHVPFLVTHGEKDRQIGVEYAHRTFDQLVNSPKRELKIFDDRTGGVEHVSLDNTSYARSFIADWIAETFQERTS